MEKQNRRSQKLDYRDAILELLGQREKGLTICPSELLKADQKSNKTMMEQVRESARKLASENKIEITQGGMAVDPNNFFKGPIRLRLKY